MLDVLQTQKTTRDEFVILRHGVSEFLEHLIQTASVEDVFLMLLGHVSNAFKKLCQSSCLSSILRLFCFLLLRKCAEQNFTIARYPSNTIFCLFWYPELYSKQSKMQGNYFKINPPGGDNNLKIHLWLSCYWQFFALGFFILHFFVILLLSYFCTKSSRFRCPVLLLCPNKCINHLCFTI